METLVISVSLRLLVSQQHPVLDDCMAAPQLFQDNHLTICLKPVGIPLQSDHSSAGHCHLQNNTAAVNYDGIRSVEGYVFCLHAIVSICSRRRCISILQEEKSSCCPSVPTLALSNKQKYKFTNFCLVYLGII